MGQVELAECRQADQRVGQEGEVVEGEPQLLQLCETAAGRGQEVGETVVGQVECLQLRDTEHTDCEGKANSKSYSSTTQ